MADKEKKKDKDKEKEKDKDKEKDKKKDKKKEKGDDDMTTRTGAKDKSKIVDNAESVMDDILASPLMKKENGCVHHQQKLMYYCEACEEPICEQCTVTGPHNNQLHRINTLEFAFKSRVMNTHQAIFGSLAPKREQLMVQAQRIDHRLEEIKHVKGMIERDVRSEFGGMLESLRSAEGVKLAVLQNEIANLQRDIDKINDIVNTVNELADEKADPIDFLLRCRHLTDTTEFTVAKPFKTTIEVVPYDLPRDLARQREKIEKMKVAQEIIDMKDHLIFELLNRLNEEEEKAAADMNKAAQEEINEWSKLTDRFASELRKYQTICYYCGCVMDTNNINRLCTANDSSHVSSGYGFTVDKPEKGWHGTQRHFFAKPKSELVKAGTANAQDYYNRPQERDPNLYKAQYQMFLEVLLAKIRRYCAEKNVEIERLFAEHDKKGNGVVNHVTFTYLLHDFCGIDVIEIEKLKTVLDPQMRGEIHYGDFVKLVNDAKYLTMFQTTE